MAVLQESLQKSLPDAGELSSASLQITHMKRASGQVRYVKFWIFLKITLHISNNIQNRRLTDQISNDKILYCVNMDEKTHLPAFLPEKASTSRF